MPPSHRSSLKQAARQRMARAAGARLLYLLRGGLACEQRRRAARQAGAPARPAAPLSWFVDNFSPAGIMRTAERALLLRDGLSTEVRLLSECAPAHAQQMHALLEYTQTLQLDGACLTQEQDRARAACRMAVALATYGVAAAGCPPALPPRAAAAAHALHDISTVLCEFVATQDAALDADTALRFADAALTLAVRLGTAPAPPYAGFENEMCAALRAAMPLYLLLDAVPSALGELSAAVRGAPLAPYALRAVVALLAPQLPAEEPLLGDGRGLLSMVSVTDASSRMLLHALLARHPAVFTRTVAQRREWAHAALAAGRLLQGVDAAAHGELACNLLTMLQLPGVVSEQLRRGVLPFVLELALLSCHCMALSLLQRVPVTDWAPETAADVRIALARFAPRVIAASSPHSIGPLLFGMHELGVDTPELAAVRKHYSLHHSVAGDLVIYNAPYTPQPLLQLPHGAAERFPPCTDAGVALCAITTPHVTPT